MNNQPTEQDSLREKIDITWLWLSHIHSKSVQLEIQESLDETMKLIEQHTAKAVKEAKIKDKIDELSLVPEHPHANITLYKETRKSELLGVLRKLRLERSK